MSRRCHPQVIFLECSSLLENLFNERAAVFFSILKLFETLGSRLSYVVSRFWRFVAMMVEKPLQKSMKMMMMMMKDNDDWTRLVVFLLEPFLYFSYFTQLPISSNPVAMCKLIVHNLVIHRTRSRHLRRIKVVLVQAWNMTCASSLPRGTLRYNTVEAAESTSWSMMLTVPFGIHVSCVARHDLTIVIDITLSPHEAS